MFPVSFYLLVSVELQFFKKSWTHLYIPFALTPCAWSVLKSAVTSSFKIYVDLHSGHMEKLLLDLPLAKNKIVKHLFESPGKWTVQEYDCEKWKTHKVSLGDSFLTLALAVGTQVKRSGSAELRKQRLELGTTKQLEPVECLPERRGQHRTGAKDLEDVCSPLFLGLHLCKARLHKTW
jgi:hypothetical protein